MKYTRENPSLEYLEAVRLGATYHATHKTYTGRHSFQQFPILRELCAKFGTRSILDFGAGKGGQIRYRDIRLLNHKDDTEKTTYATWMEALNVDSYWLYDPCLPQYRDLPSEPQDGVFSCDVLQYIPVSDTPWVLDQMFSFAKQWVYSSFAIFPGTKSYEDGKDAHRNHNSIQWWIEEWYKVGLRYPDVFWSFRIEPSQPPISHRYFCGQGGQLWEGERFWKIWKPQQLVDLSKKQREELEMLAKENQEAIDLESIISHYK